MPSRWSPLRRTFRLRQLLLALPMLLVFMVTATQTAAASPSGSQAKRALTVATFNIHHGAGNDGVVDLDRIARVIRSTHATVVGVEEVDRHFSARSDFMDEPAILADKLDMGYVFGANIDQPAATPGQPDSQFGTLILSRYPILASVHYLLPRSPGKEQRGLLGAKVDVDGLPMWFYNTHLEAYSKTDREAQAAAIKDLVHLDATPTILTGDMNVKPDSPVISTFDSFLTDTWTVAGEGDGYTWPSTSLIDREDYIFGAPDTVRALRDQTVDTDPNAADHLPVTAKVVIGPVQT